MSIGWEGPASTVSFWVQALVDSGLPIQRRLNATLPVDACFEVRSARGQKSMTERLMTEKWRAWFCCRDPTTGKTKMPMQVDANIRHLDRAEFGEIAYQAIDHILAVHNKMGRFLDEASYRNAVNITRASVTFQSITKA